MLTRERLKELVTYCKVTGLFKWKIGRAGCRKGAVCGSVGYYGYTNIVIDRKSYGAHRLAFLYVEGFFPEEVDHLDHNTSNNSWANLRAVSHIKNQRNRSLNKNSASGFNGVSWIKSTQRWYSSIQMNGKTKNLGFYLTLIDAVAARIRANEQYGFHGNHGR